MGLGFRFSEDRKEQTVLIYNDKVVAHVEQIDGFEILRTNILDTAIDSLSGEIQARGIDMGILSTKKKPKVSEEVDVADKKQPHKNHSSAVYLIDALIVLFIAITWMSGVVLAKGIWLKILATCFPFYGWYLETEILLQHLALLS